VCLHWKYCPLATLLPQCLWLESERVGRGVWFGGTYTRLCSALNLAKAAATALSSAPPTSAACVAPKSTPTRAKASAVMVAGWLGDSNRAVLWHNRKCVLTNNHYELVRPPSDDQRGKLTVPSSRLQVPAARGANVKGQRATRPTAAPSANPTLAPSACQTATPSAALTVSPTASSAASPTSCAFFNPHCNRKNH
jgi:hypothetical protein